MDTGMMWQNTDLSLKLEEKVVRAKAYYILHFGFEPGVCFVHPNMLPAEGKYGAGEQRQMVGLIVKPSLKVREGYFWLGVDFGQEEAPTTSVGRAFKTNRRRSKRRGL